MRYLKHYKLFESTSTDWSKLCQDLIYGYYNYVDEENGLSQLIDDVDDICLDISDIGYKLSSKQNNLYFDYDRLIDIPKRKITHISVPSDGRIKYIHHKKTVKLLLIDSATYSYSHYKEISSLLKKVLESDLETGWFGVSLYFDGVKATGVVKRNLLRELKVIKTSLESRGWIINQEGFGDDWVIDRDELSFNIIRPVSLTMANEFLKNQTVNLNL